MPLTKLDAGRSERAHQFPQILPGGGTVVFASNSVNSVGGFDDASIEAVSLVEVTAGRL